MRIFIASNYLIANYPQSSFHKLFKVEDVKICKFDEDISMELHNFMPDIFIFEMEKKETDFSYGFEILSKTRESEIFDKTIIIVLINDNNKELVKECVRRGANDYLFIPVEESDLLTRVAISKKMKESQHRIIETKSRMIRIEKLATMGELFSGVVHEIKNPISYLSSNLDALEIFIPRIQKLLDGYEDLTNAIENQKFDRVLIKEKVLKIKKLVQENKIDIIKKDIESLIIESKTGVERILGIISGMMNLNKMGEESEIDVININSIINDIMPIVKSRYNHVAHIELRLNEIKKVHCNRMQLGQVFLNIIVNAMQAINDEKRENRGTIIIETSEDNNNVCCKITDDGPGILESDIEHIFEPFFTTKKNGTGTGLGLSISHDIITIKHKGNLFVESKFGIGTTFIIFIPNQIDKIE